ncbi:MAG TPA: PilN domain-containing protein [Anaeromyxobacter sp.]
MIRINLLPVRVSKKATAGKQQIVLFVALIVAGYIGNFLWAQSRGAEVKSRVQKVQKTREEIVQLDRIIGEVKNIKDQQAALREKLDILGELKANRSGPVKVMDALATLTPKRLWIMKLDEKGGNAVLTGQATTFDDVSNFMTALKGNPQFANVELSKTAAVTSQGARKIDLVDFNLGLQILYGSKPPPPAPKGSR